MVRIDVIGLDLINGPLPSYRDRMFQIHCPRHQSRVLLGSRAVEALVNTPDGVVVHWRCHCGATGTLATGRPSSMTQPTRTVASAA